MIHTIKGFSEIQRCSIHTTTSRVEIVDGRLQSKNSISATQPRLEAKLQVINRQICLTYIKEQRFKEFRNYRNQGNGSVILNIIQIPCFIFNYRYYSSSAKAVRYKSMSEYA